MYIEPIIFALERLWDVLKHESSILVVDEKNEIESLERELQLIESYFKDIDEVQRQASLSHVLQTKLQHLTEILTEIEEFLDKKAQQAYRSRMKDFKAFFCSGGSSSNTLLHKHNFVKRVNEIREQLGETLQSSGKYQVITNKSPHFASKRRRPLTNSILLTDEIIVGLQNDVETLVTKFFGENGECGACYYAIIGMGGSGKTTLAKMFYNHIKIKEAFPRRGWVCVSQEWSSHDLMLQICAIFGVRLSEDEKLIPHVKLQELFDEGANCLVVLDDVWEKKALQELLPLLLSGNGRVLITTRKENIVKFPRIGTFYLHKVSRLTSEQSWDLFSRIIGNCSEGDINFEEEEEDGYVNLGKEMLEKCRSLPLAVVTLAGLLGTKTTIQQWESIKDCVVSTIMMEGDDDSHEAVKKVLELSYFDLPYDLKPCFLYLGIYKEDAKILTDKLFNLWIEEGFVKADQRKPEEAAKICLEELVQRCIVQVINRDYNGDVHCFQIHDLVRDLCIKKANELGFFQVLSPSTATISTPKKLSNRRLVIYDNLDRNFFSDINPRIKTLIYKNPGYSQRSLPFEKFKLLRVLCILSVELRESAKSIGNMVFLRYLGCNQLATTLEIYIS